MGNDTIIKINGDADIIRCRTEVRKVAVELGYSIPDQTRMVTAASELARNIVNYSGEGRMIICLVSNSSKNGIKLIFEDNGPGFDIGEAMEIGFSTGNGLGLGLPGSQKLMDEFDVKSKKGKGTTVTAVKWFRS